MYRSGTALSLRRTLPSAFTTDGLQRWLKVWYCTLLAVRVSQGHQDCEDQTIASFLRMVTMECCPEKYHRLFTIERTDGCYAPHSCTRLRYRKRTWSRWGSGAAVRIHTCRVVRVDRPRRPKLSPLASLQRVYNSSVLIRQKPHQR